MAVGMTASQATATYIVASDFNQTDGVAIDTVAPNIANLPGAATWFQTGEVGGPSMVSTTSAWDCHG